MGSFFKRSLGKILAKRGEPSSVGVYVAAFGKHPGWDDHIEDLGIETERLVNVKRVLYTQGIAGNIDSGAWEKLQDHERREGFHHLFVWRTSRDVVVGRMWSSRDGKGRTRYPMVVCAQATGLELHWVFQHVLPRLADIETRCTQTTDAADVRAVISETCQVLRLEASPLEPAREILTPSPRALGRLADSPEMEPNRQGIHRILYQIEREMSAYRAEGPEISTSSTTILRAAEMRVPACAPNERAAATLWLSFLLAQLDRAASMLLILPIDESYLDIVVGVPGVQQFFCVRASTAAVPLATEIPYNLDDEFIAKAESRIDESRGGPAQARPATPAEAPAAATAVASAEPKAEPAPEPPSEEPEAPEPSRAPETGAAPPPQVEPEPEPPQAQPETSALPEVAEPPETEAREPEPPTPEPEPPEPEPAAPEPEPEPPEPEAEPEPVVAAPPPPEEPEPDPQPIAEREPEENAPTAVAEPPTPVREEPEAPPQAAAPVVEEAFAPTEPARPEPTPEPPAAGAPVFAAEEPGVGPGRRAAKLWPLFLIVVVLAVLGLLLIPLLRQMSDAPEKQKEEPGAWLGEQEGAWKELCEDYNGWFARLMEEAGKQRLVGWRRDPELAKVIVKHLAKARKDDFDPRAIIGQKGGTYTDLALNPPRAAKTRQSINKTKYALDIVNAIEGELKQWPERGETGIANAAAQYVERGWAKPGETLKTLAEAVAPAPGATVADALDRALEAKLAVMAIEQRFARIRTHEKVIAVLGDDAVASVHELALAETRKADTLGRLLADIGRVEAGVREVAKAAQGVQARGASLRALADEEVASKYVNGVKALVGGAAGFGEYVKRVAQAAPLGEKIEGQLKAVKANRDAIAGMNDQTLAAKLWALARVDVLAAPDLPSLSDRLKGATAQAEQIAAQRKAVEQHRQAMKGLGDDVLDRHTQLLQAATEKAQDTKGLAVSLDEAAGIAKAIAEAWASLQTHQKTIEGSGDKVLAAFGTHVAAAARSEKSLKALPGKLQEVQTAAKDLAAFVQADWKGDKIDKALFAKESAVHRAFGDKVTEKTLQDWRKEVASYYRLDPAKDPRPAREAVAAALEDARWRIDFLKDSPEADKKAKGREAEERYKTVAAGLAKLAGQAWIRRNESAIRQAAADVSKRLADLQAELAKVIEPPEKWLARIRADKKICTSDALNGEWGKRRDALAPARLTPKGLMAKPTDYKQRWHGVRAVREFLADLDDEKQLPKGVPDAAKGVPDGPTRKAVLDAVGAKREEALRSVVGGITWLPANTPDGTSAKFKTTGRWTEPCTQYAQWRGHAGALLAAAHAMGALIDAGYLPDDKPDGAPKSLKQLLADWGKENVPKELAPHFNPVVERARALVALEQLPRDKLVDQASKLADKDPPQVCMIVWRRLGNVKDWPKDITELHLELALRQRVAKVSRDLNARNAHAVRWAPDELKAQGTRRWGACLERLAKQAPANDLADPDLASAMKLAAKFGVAAEQLSPAARLIRELHGFRHAAAALPDEEPKEKIDTAIAAFLNALSALPGGVASQPAAAALRKELAAFAKLKEPDDPSVGLDKAGPAGGQMAAHWKPTVAPDGKMVTYAWQDKGHALTFLRVEPDDKTSKPCYLCSGEVSVGLFIDAIRATGKWAELNGLLEGYERLNAPKGPRVWEWGRRRQQLREIELPDKWLNRESRTGQHYADGLQPTKGPSASAPMQYVSAPAAMHIAWILGCRLPTAAEWRAAYELASKAPPAAKPNLRDPTWQKQQDHMSKKSQQGIRPEWPDAGAFWAASVKNPKRGSDAVVAAKTDDSVLWFEPVGSGKAFHALVGNVAEFIFDRPADYDERLAKLSPADAGKASAVFIKLAQEKDGALQVIGGSALSAPELWDGKQVPFAKAWPVTMRKNGRDSFSDVGFRLAFTAPRETPADQLRRILRRRGYLADDAK